MVFIEMYDSGRWRALVEGETCPVCHEPPEWPPLAVLPSGMVVLQDDADFRGYCVLYHRKHVTELYDLDVGERAQFIEDLDRVSRAVRDVCAPAKVNYAILGNIVPHLHCHLIPRYPDDGWWGQPIWARPAERKTILPPDDYDTLFNALRAALTAQTE